MRIKDLSKSQLSYNHLALIHQIFSTTLSELEYVLSKVDFDFRTGKSLETFQKFIIA